MWKVEPYFIYRVTNLISGVVYDETDVQVQHRLDSQNVEIISSKAAEVLFDEGDETL